MDAKISIKSELEGNGFYVAQFKTVDLAIFSYYIESGKEAILIDPTYDVKVYDQLRIKRNATLKYIGLSHYHADYLSGHTQFAVPVIMGQGSKKQVQNFKIEEHEDGSSFTVGQISITVLHTPGHTLESSCFLLHDVAKKPIALFTGDTVFLGEVGRPDLAAGGPEHITVHDLAGMLYDSIQKLKKLDGEIRIYPGHGSGSACGKAIGDGNFCTLENQIQKNYGFLFKEREAFIKGVAQGLAKPPSYFFHDSNLNQQGPPQAINLTKTANKGLTVKEFKEVEQKEKAVIIDTRADVGQGIIRGSYWLTSKGAISNWLANIIKPADAYLIICNEGQAENIIERFFRIGYFNVQGYNNFKVSEWTGEIVKAGTLTFEELAQEKQYIHLDVRSKPEWLESSVIENAILIPLPELEKRIGELKGKDNFVVNCKTGMRARVATSILLKYGYTARVLSEKFDSFAEKGFKMVKYTA